MTQESLKYMTEKEKKSQKRNDGNGAPSNDRDLLPHYLDTVRQPACPGDVDPLRRGRRAVLPLELPTARHQLPRRPRADDDGSSYAPRPRPLVVPPRRLVPRPPSIELRRRTTGIRVDRRTPRIKGQASILSI